jgi:hypothetical protein
VHRQGIKDIDTLIESYNQNFERFLTENNLIKYLNSTFFDFKKGGWVTALFKVETVEEGNLIVNEYNERLGVLGEQRVYVSVKAQTLLKVNNELFTLLKTRFE